MHFVGNLKSQNYYYYYYIIIYYILLLYFIIITYILHTLLFYRMYLTCKKKKYETFETKYLLRHSDYTDRIY